MNKWTALRGRNRETDRLPPTVFISLTQFEFQIWIDGGGEESESERN